MRAIQIRPLAAAILLACIFGAGINAQSQVPTPESVLGFKPGADFKLASYDQTLDYFQRLDAASDRLTLIEVGRTTNGLPMVIALISSAENLRNVERYRQISLRLAHPEGLSDDEARQLAREGKAIIHIDGGMHSSEVADHQHTIQLAYDIITGDADPEIRAILDNVILILWPTLNPDGQNMVAQWYMSNVGTRYETSGMPQLYQEYVGHDNNRDGYMIDMIESRVWTRVLREWEPQILYNHHQTAPFPTRIWIPPFAEPISPYVHPLMWRTVNLIGMSMSQALEERGQEGATHMGTGFDDWYPGFMDHANSFHNVASLLTETGLFRYATPGYYTVNDFPENKQDLRPESLYSSPWKGGWWRLADACAYMHTASISVLDVGAKYKFDILYNRYQAGRDIIAQYEEEPPFAYFIPQKQRDPVAPVELLRRLAFNGIEVHQLTRPMEFEGLNHPAGTWVIPMNQPFANFVRQLFDVQEYPEIRDYPGGPLDRPYDVAGWTLPYQMDVRVIEASVPLTDELRASLEPVSGRAVAWDAPNATGATFDSPPDVGFDTSPAAAGIVPPAGSIRGRGTTLVLDPAQNNSFRALNEAWKAGGKVQFMAGRPGIDGQPGQSGTYLVTGVSESVQRGWAESFALQAQRSRATGTDLARPRIGLFRPWGGNMDEGWTRWVLEMYGFEYTCLRPSDIKVGQLSERFDVIIFADMGASSIIEGRAESSVPARYAGGIGQTGVMLLDSFVRDGGTIVCLNGSSNFAINAFNLPVKNVTGDIPREEFYMASSLLSIVTDPSHPVMAGMPARATAFVGRSPMFETTEGFQGYVLAKYPESGALLMSGYLEGEEHVLGRAAALDVQHGNGHVILIGFKPQWRGQPFGTFRILFNAAIFHGAVAAGAQGTPDFWSSPDTGDEEGGK